jgi:hypothetical protein
MAIKEGKMVALQHFKRGSHLVKSRINARQRMRRKARKLGKEVVN